MEVVPLWTTFRRRWREGNGKGKVKEVNWFVLFLELSHKLGFPLFFTLFWFCEWMNERMKWGHRANNERKKREKWIWRIRVIKTKREKEKVEKVMFDEFIFYGKTKEKQETEERQGSIGCVVLCVFLCCVREESPCHDDENEKHGRE